MMHANIDRRFEESSMMMSIFYRLLARLVLIIFIGCSVASPFALARDLIKNPTFNNAREMASFWSTDNVELSYQNNLLCAQITQRTENPWDALVGLSDLSLVQGEEYSATVQFQNPSENISIKIQLAEEPWTNYFTLEAGVGARSNIFEVSFVADKDYPDLQLVIELGGADARTICAEEISISHTNAQVKSNQTNEIVIRLNQHGYLPNGPKFANLVQLDDRPVEWQLKNNNGQTEAKGVSQPLGFDPSSGLKSHLIDFSNVRASGRDFVLHANGVRSHAFDIADGLYDQMRRDALSYFYLVRSGTEISGGVAGAQFARRAGHVSDQDVGCLSQSSAQEIYGKSWSCDYRLDVSGGWYDAGDYGKYVVNGGIAVAQMLATYEHALWLKGASSPVLKQGYARTDNRSGVLPDVLSEAKWQLDFLMKMQVPSGPYQGMAHHKVHGLRWNALPLWPHRDDVPRALHPPSTAATLNLAATTAQAARIFAPYDAAYAEKLFQVAQNAYRAAQQNSDLLAPDTSGAHGGGDYPDGDVSDEFYWAASELYITSSNDQFLADMKSSPHWEGDVFRSSGITWDFVAGWARLQLALSPNKLPTNDRMMIQQSVIDGAEGLINIQDAEAFGLAYPAIDGLPWGSNNNVLQNMIVLAGAYHLTGGGKYISAAFESMDYILGRNAIGQSYVTGFGTKFSEQQHSRLFARQLDRNFPPMPSGALAGGPNSWMSDDYIRQERENCAPQACYIDNSKSYSTNEIAINWNAGLTYVTSFLADYSNP